MTGVYYTFKRIKRKKRYGIIMLRNNLYICKTIAAVTNPGKSMYVLKSIRILEKSDIAWLWFFYDCKKYQIVHFTGFL
jgi:hypothetical protein